MPKVTLIPSTINPLTHTAIDSITKRRVCGYARVSTDRDEQFTSYEAQVDYYTKLIKSKRNGNLYVFILMKVLLEHLQRKEMALINDS